VAYNSVRCSFGQEEPQGRRDLDAGTAHRAIGCQQGIRPSRRQGSRRESADRWVGPRSDQLLRGDDRRQVLQR
jgi:hypothetical protein